MSPRSLKPPARDLLEAIRDTLTPPDPAGVCATEVRNALVAQRAAHVVGLLPLVDAAGPGAVAAAIRQGADLMPVTYAHIGPQGAPR
ncbi:hypothetical protein [Nocardiopsis baichengensis]|uniref:hypothetical protein n=1 Tax=Nocardiopsis baichengensis TaxID=280240 RepID=UPI00034AC167|nr:hypothetical protein [Nocardiopsis baichengensis]